MRELAPLADRLGRAVVVEPAIGRVELRYSTFKKTYMAASNHSVEEEKCLGLKNKSRG
jgi:hypothetical protein